MNKGDTMSRAHARLTGFAAGSFMTSLRDLSRRVRERDRGDVPGWVLVTLMTAGLVITLWAVASPRLEEVFNHAIDSVMGR